MTDSASQFIQKMFGIDGKVAVVTGATGVLGGAMARGLAQAGVKIAVLGRRRDRAEAVAQEIIAAGGQALATPADVLDKAQLEAARDQVVGAWGGIDILVNAAGGTTPEATIPPDRNFFQMDMDATRYVVDLNLLGTLLPCYVFGEVMARKQAGCIINISSMSAQRAFTRAVAYAVGKTAVESITQSLAVELATKFGEGMRVNAIAPGFFVGEQNRALLLNPDDTLTTRGQKIIDHTPFGRFGEPEDLVGTLLWLCSPAASFVTGTTTMVDGGANAFSGI